MDERTSSKNAHEAAGWAWGWRLSLAQLDSLRGRAKPLRVRLRWCGRARVVDEGNAGIKLGMQGLGERYRQMDPPVIVIVIVIMIIIKFVNYDYDCN